MHEEETCFPSQDLQEMLQPTVLSSSSSKNQSNDDRIN
jgi:hypothetical protein